MYLTHNKIELVSKFEEGNTSQINNFLNSYNLTELERLEKYFNQNLKKFLTKRVYPEDGENFDAIMPFNLLRYLTLKELISNKRDNKDFKLETFLIEFYDSLENKNIIPDHFEIPRVITSIFNSNKWGKSEDPFKSWKKDNRKILYDLIIRPWEKDLINSEIENLGRRLQRRLKYGEYQVKPVSTWGSQNNSFNDHCWVALIPIGQTLKNSVHLGIRIYKDKYICMIRVGDDRLKKNKNIPTRIHTYSSDNFDDIIEHLVKIEKHCIYLNDKTNKDNLQNEIEDTITPVDITSNFREMNFKNNSKKDSRSLQNKKTSYEIMIESYLKYKTLYLIKIKGVSFGNSNKSLYKVGVTNSTRVEKRFSEIASGFGMKSHISIIPLLVYTNKGDSEEMIKEWLIDSKEFEYCNEYFYSDINTESLVQKIKEII
jgi:hypothetical protein